MTRCQKAAIQVLTLAVAVVGLLLGPATGAPAQTATDPSLSPPLNARAFDTPSDAGGYITIEWDISAQEEPEKELVQGYEIYRAEFPGEAFEPIDVVPAGSTSYRDPNTDDEKTYRYRVVAFSEKGTSLPAVTNPARSSLQFFNFNKLNLLLIAIVISATVIFYIQYIKAGGKTFIRKIAGLEAVDEAIGRATEMGRPILFIPGIQDMNDIQTIAGVIILGRIAKAIAEYDTRLEVPTSRALVMTTARETVKEAYLSAGRPDAYSDDMIYYLTDEQFGYVAGVNGIMVRKKPATCFYMGAFFAESLILAETGNSIGAIQIAGTAMPAQLPFFIAACDYTLIGEELFAASAYLSGEPRQLGSLKGQDMGKLMAMVFITFGVIIGTLAVITGNPTLASFVDWYRELFSVAD